MAIVQVLKRKDASSVIVAVTIATILAQFLPTVVGNLASKIVGLKEGTFASYAFPGSGWKGEYLYPVVLALLELILLEVVIWAYVGVKALASGNKK